ncbi:MAG: hypothetical protein ACTSX8_01635 [Alphaproteobacteria bacterium]
MADLEIVGIAKMSEIGTRLRAFGPQWDRDQRKVLQKVGRSWQRASRKNAPFGETSAQHDLRLDAILRTKYGKAGVAKHRSKRRGVALTKDAAGNAQPTSQEPGGLTASIRYDLPDADAVRVRVPINSQAGKYAKRIHDEKGKTWFRRGRGTKRKGAQADDKYIERALKSGQRKWFDWIHDALGITLKAAFR